MKKPTELIVALDFPRADRALQLIEQTQGLPIIYKVGFELFMSAGPEFVRELVHRQGRVFLDLKFNDIPNTVAKAARQAAALRVEMFTLHLSGGSAMLRAVAKEFEGISELKPKILGVTVLTSFDDIRWAEVTQAMTGHTALPSDSVDRLVTAASSWGADGVVCSAHELALVKSRAPQLYTVVPGIRPIGGDAGDQARVMTPTEAARAGASAIVMGRPVTESKDPKTFIQGVLSELRQA